MTQFTLPDSDLAAALDGVTTEHFFTEEQFESLKAKYEKDIKRLQNKLAMSEASYKRLSENNNKNIAENARLRKIISEKDSELQDTCDHYSSCQSY